VGRCEFPPFLAPPCNPAGLVNPEIASSANQVASTSSPQDQLISTIGGNISISSHFSHLDTKHSAFASSISLAQKTPFTNSPKAPWIIDTGATDHMICSISLFTSITSITSKTVKLPNGQYDTVTHIGTVKISETFILIDVFCNPSFSFNLISVSKLIKNMQCCFIFFFQFCFIQHLTRWMTIVIGKEEGGLYHLLQDPVFVLLFNSVLNKSTLLNSALTNSIVLHFNNHNGNPD
jgi:hypothetical protein